MSKIEIVFPSARDEKVKKKEKLHKGLWLNSLQVNKM